MSQPAAGDGGHVIDIDVDDRAQRKHQLAAPANHCHIIDIDVDRTAERKHGLAAPSDHYHAIDVDGTAARLAPELPECAVCMEHLSWVAIGPCGHLKVCSTCAVRLRAVDRYLQCCICRTRCPTVVVTGRSNSTGDDGKHIYNKVSSLKLTADEGRTGSYWYHKASAVYFDDKRQYDEAKRACSESQLKRAAEVRDQDENDNARGSLVLIFLVYLAIIFSVLLGSRFGFAAMGCIFWFLMDRLQQRRGRQQ